MGMMVKPVIAPKVTPNDAERENRFGDDEGARFVECQAAIFFGRVGAQQTEISAAFHELPIRSQSLASSRSRTASTSFVTNS